MAKREFAKRFCNHSTPFASSDDIQIFLIIPTISIREVYCNLKIYMAKTRYPQFSGQQFAFNLSQTVCKTDETDLNFKYLKAFVLFY